MKRRTSARTGWIGSGRSQLGGERQDLRGVLVVPARTPSLLDDVAEQRLAWEDLGAGYWRVTGGSFTLCVVEIDHDHQALALPHQHPPGRTGGEAAARGGIRARGSTSARPEPAH
jgi:hypothetical protein